MVIILIEDSKDIFLEIKSAFEDYEIEVLPEANFCEEAFNDETGEILFNKIWEIIMKRQINGILMDLYLSHAETNGGKTVTNFISIKVANKICDEIEKEKEGYKKLPFIFVTAPPIDQTEFETFENVKKDWQIYRKSELQNRDTKPNFIKYIKKCFE